MRIQLSKKLLRRLLLLIPVIVLVTLGVYGYITYLDINKTWADSSMFSYGNFTLPLSFENTNNSKVKITRDGNKVTVTTDYCALTDISANSDASQFQYNCLFADLALFNADIFQKQYTKPLVKDDIKKIVASAPKLSWVYKKDVSPKPEAFLGADVSTEASFESLPQMSYLPSTLVEMLDLPKNPVPVKATVQVELQPTQDTFVNRVNHYFDVKSGKKTEVPATLVSWKIEKIGDVTDFEKSADFDTQFKEFATNATTIITSALTNGITDADSADKKLATFISNLETTVSGNQNCLFTAAKGFACAKYPNFDLDYKASLTDVIRAVSLVERQNPTLAKQLSDIIVAKLKATDKDELITSLDGRYSYAPICPAQTNGTAGTASKAMLDAYITYKSVKSSATIAVTTFPAKLDYVAELNKQLPYENAAYFVDIACQQYLSGSIVKNVAIPDSIESKKYIQFYLSTKYSFLAKSATKATYDYFNTPTFSSLTKNKAQLADYIYWNLKTRVVNTAYPSQTFVSPSQFVPTISDRLQNYSYWSDVYNTMLILQNEVY